VIHGGHCVKNSRFGLSNAGDAPANLLRSRASARLTKLRESGIDARCRLNHLALCRPPLHDGQELPTPHDGVFIDEQTSYRALGIRSDRALGVSNNRPRCCDRFRHVFQPGRHDCYRGAARPPENGADNGAADDQNNQPDNPGAATPLRSPDAGNVAVAMPCLGFCHFIPRSAVNLQWIIPAERDPNEQQRFHDV
jgi:hypothetical protein